MSKIQSPFSSTLLLVSTNSLGEYFCFSCQVLHYFQQFSICLLSVPMLKELNIVGETSADENSVKRLRGCRGVDMTLNKHVDQVTSLSLWFFSVLGLAWMYKELSVSVSVWPMAGLSYPV